MLATPDGLGFDAYAPNSPHRRIAASPLTLTFDRAAQRFYMPATRFIGGPVDLYEVYGDAWH